MNLYILRHASAGTRRANPIVDVKRPLDRDGKAQCLLVGSYLNSLKVQFDLIASSPLKRALQTASLVGTEVAYDSRVLIAEELSPESSVTSFQRLVSALSGYENVLLVGHNPNVTQFLSALVTSAGKLHVRLRKGALARVDYSSRPGQLLWLVEPRLLRAFYSTMAKSSRRKTSRK